MSQARSQFQPSQFAGRVATDAANEWTEFTEDDDDLDENQVCRFCGYGVSALLTWASAVPHRIERSCPVLHRCISEHAGASSGRDVQG